MWPFRKKFTKLAIPYIKSHIFDTPESDSNVLKLTLENSPVLRDFIPGLSIAYLVDSGSLFTYIQNHHLTKDKVTEDELHKIALRNLSAIPTEIHPHSKIFAVIAGGNFEASMILNYNLLKYINENFKSGIIAAIPARDIFAFAPIGDSSGLKELNDLVTRIGDTQDHPLIKWLIRYDGTSWSRFSE